MAAKKPLLCSFFGLPISLSVSVKAKNPNLIIARSTLRKTEKRLPPNKKEMKKLGRQKGRENSLVRGRDCNFRYQRGHDVEFVGG